MCVCCAYDDKAQGAHREETSCMSQIARAASKMTISALCRRQPSRKS